MTEYETELRELSLFVPEMVHDEEALCSKFELGLNLSIREKMSITDSCTYKDVLQLALRAESMTLERGKVRENKRKRRFGGNPSQGFKRSKSMGSYSGSASMGGSDDNSQSQRVIGRSSSAQSASSGIRFSRSNANKGVCPNCTKPHAGPCREPTKCYYCHH